MQEQPKVLICVRRMDRGGAEMLECRLAVELNKLGMETGLAGQYSEDSFDGKHYSHLLKEQGVSEIFWMNSDNLGFFKTLNGLKNIIKNGGYNIIITHNNGLDIYVGLCKLYLNIKHIIAFHDYFYKEKINPVKFNVWKFFVGRADAFYAITDKVKENITTLFNASSAKGITIYNSIHFGQPSANKESLRQKYGIQAGKKIVVSIGRVHPNKGFDLALKHLAEIPEAEYFIIGQIEDAEYVEKLKSDAVNLGMADRVHIIGFCSNIFDVLSQADLFVHLARHEGFGLVIVEAIAAGVPIVVSNAGGIPEILKQTPYTPFNLEDQQYINAEINKYLNMDKIALADILETAKLVLPFYTDQRRATEIKAIIENICAE